MKVSMLLAAVLLVVSSLAQAELDHDGIKQQHSQHQLSKRPYATPVVDKEVLEGASVTEEVVVEKKHQPLRLHMLGKLPYMEKATD